MATHGDDAERATADEMPAGKIVDPCFGIKNEPNCGTRGF